MDLFDLTGRAALVTGGGRGLGKAMALGLAAAGANVAVASRTPEQLEATLAELRAAGPAGEHMAVPCDVADLPELEQAVSRVAARYGGLDVLLNAAGLQLRKPALEVTPADYDYLMSVNLRAAYFATIYAARAMRERGRGGKIIHVASLGTRLGLPKVSLYNVAKSGIGGLVRGLGVELAPYAIQVNGVGPGYFRTELTESLFQHPEGAAWVRRRIPMGRTGEPEDLAGAAVFLASRASDYMTGQVIFVDGGWLAG